MPIAAACALTVCFAPPAAAQAEAAGLTGETLTSLPDAAATGTCSRQGSSTYTFTVSGTAVGPYPGTFTETGTVTIGPQTEEFVPGQFRGPLTAFQAQFTIISAAGTVTGTKTLIPNQPSPFNVGVCSDGGSGAQAIANRLSYSATITPPIGPTHTDQGTSAAEFNLCTAPPEACGISSSPNFVETFTSMVAAQPACADGVDNDGDLLIDYPADPGCQSPTDDSESPDPPLPPPACPDDDADDDGLIDEVEGLFGTLVDDRDSDDDGVADGNEDSDADGEDDEDEDDAEDPCANDSDGDGIDDEDEDDN